jgi:hypothetical protein
MYRYFIKNDALFYLYSEVGMFRYANSFVEFMDGIIEKL